MFCYHCGSRIPDGDMFCSACGNAVGQNFQSQKAQVRQSELGVLTEAFGYFSEKKMQYDRYDEVCRQLQQTARGSSNALIIWGAILSVFAMLVLLVGSENTMEEDIVPLVLFGVLPMLGSIAMVVGGILKKVSHARRVEELRLSYMQLSVELFGHFANYPTCPIGAEYTNPAIISYLMSLIQSGRADTVKESLNLAVGKSSWSIGRYLNQMAELTAEQNARTAVPVIFIASNLF